MTKKHLLIMMLCCLVPVIALGAGLLTGLYFGIVSWAESPQHAFTLFWHDRWIVLPIILISSHDLKGS